MEKSHEKKFKPGDIIKTKHGTLFYITDEPVTSQNRVFGNRLFVIRILVSENQESFHYLYERDLDKTVIATDKDIIEELIRRSLMFEVEDASISVDLEGPYFHIDYNDYSTGISLNVNQVRELKRILNEFNI